VKYGIVNCDIHTGDEVLYNKAILIDGNRIERTLDIDNVPKEIEVLDAEGLNVAPGFIDIQVNGAGGKLFTDEPDEDCIRTMFNAQKRFGTTNFLPTLMSTSVEKMLRAINTVKSLVESRKFGVLGLHLEGPYFNENKIGVHDKRYVRKMSASEIELIVKQGKGAVKVFTVAPEAIDESHIRKITQAGIIVSAGHTNATYNQTAQAFRSGMTSVTHIFNAMSQLTAREPGVVGAALDYEKVWAGIIADGLHVDIACIRVCKRIKGARLILVTDSMPPVGSNISSFKLGELEVLYSDGKCVTKDGVLGGSALDMATAVRNCVQKAGIPMSEALRMASTYPAEFLGVDGELGKIKPGYVANLVIFDNQLDVKGVIIDGMHENV